MFTARYALSPYIKQIRFVFKGLINRSLILEYGLGNSVISTFIYMYVSGTGCFIISMDVCASGSLVL
jgi:hypothetical protein